MMKNCKENGNVLVYILLAVALLAALTFAISGDERGQQTNQIDSARATLHADQIISQVSSIQIAVNQMLSWGKTQDDLRFDRPGTAGYSLNVSDQIYHPSGGGIKPLDTPSTMIDESHVGSYWPTPTFKNTTNVQWTQSPATELTYAVGALNEQVCSALNEKILGDPTIPIVSTSAALHARFSGYSGSSSSWNNSSCPECINKKSICVEAFTANGSYVFYTLLTTR